MYTPDLLTMTDGTPVTSSAQWEARRGELLNILAREQYGTFLPPSTASARVMAPPMPACAGHALQETLEVRFDTPAGEFAFPLRFLYPADGQAHPLFLLLNFRPLIPDIYCPAEESSTTALHWRSCATQTLRRSMATGAAGYAGISRGSIPTPTPASSFSGHTLPAARWMC